MELQQVASGRNHIALPFTVSSAGRIDITVGPRAPGIGARYHACEVHWDGTACGTGEIKSAQYDRLREGQRLWVDVREVTRSNCVRYEWPSQECCSS